MSMSLKKQPLFDYKDVFFLSVSMPTLILEVTFSAIL